MHNLMFRGAGRRRVAAVAAATVVAGGVAGAALLVPGALASSSPGPLPADRGSPPVPRVNGSPGEGSIGVKLNCSRRVADRGWGSCKLTLSDTAAAKAYDVNAVIALPSALHAVFCRPGLGRTSGCVLRNGAASWHLGTLAAGQSRSATVSFTARHPAKVTVAGIGMWGIRDWSRPQQSAITTAQVTIG